MYLSLTVIAVLVVGAWILISGAKRQASETALHQAEQNYLEIVAPIFNALWLEGARWRRQLNDAAIEPLVDATLLGNARRSAHSFLARVGSGWACDVRAIEGAHSVSDLVAELLQNDLAEERLTFARERAHAAHAAHAAPYGDRFRFAPSESRLTNAEPSETLNAEPAGLGGVTAIAESGEGALSASTCPECQRPTMPDARLCGHCWAPLPLLARRRGGMPALPTNTPQEDGRLPCPHCARSIACDATRCGHCWRDVKRNPGG